MTALADGDLERLLDGSPARRLVERTTSEQGVPFLVEDAEILAGVAGALARPKAES
jgi:hypothetical protein